MIRLTSLLSPPGRRHPARLALETLEDRTAPARVGYYDMNAGAGISQQATPITAAGHTPVQLFTLTAAELATIDVLMVQNPNNSAYGAEYLSRLADIEAAVAGGMTLVLHDRFVANAENILPAGSAFNIVRDFSDPANINVLDNSTVLTNGPGGVIDDTTLDNGNSSSHGFAFSASLPAQARRLLSTGDPTHVVTFSYHHGQGTVLYSTIPLDFYLGGFNPASFRQIYAPNVVAYGAGLLNAPPVAQDAAFATAEDTPLSGTLPASDPDGDPLTYSLISGPAHGEVTITDPARGAFTYTPDPGFSGSDSFVFRVSDGRAEDTAVVTITVTPVNDLPSVDAGANREGDEGGTFSFAGSAQDADGDALTYTWDFGDGSAPASGPEASHTYADNGDYTVTLTVDDGNGGVVSDTLTVTVLNAAPAVGAVTAPIDPQEVGTTSHVSAPFGDPGTGDTHTATWDWGDGTSSAGALSPGSVGGSHTYTAAGVYTVTLTVTDDDGGSATSVFQYVVVYDPSAGFVTGGGWINSPAGAYLADPGAAGKAHFGFVARYQKGQSTPDGETEFRLTFADFTFNSTSYDWLVVAGAKAMFKGEGTLNGAGNYRFQLTARDAEAGGSPDDPDRFRIRIWDHEGSLIYDNQVGEADPNADPTTALGGGSIVLHAGT